MVVAVSEGDINLTGATLTRPPQKSWRLFSISTLRVVTQPPGLLPGWRNKWTFLLRYVEYDFANRGLKSHSLAMTIFI